MTMIEKAIAYLQEQSCKKSTTAEGVHFNSMAIRALQARQPLPVNHERNFWRYYHYCPTCCEKISIEGLKYCEKCGQHLDWSNYETGLKYVR